MTFSEFITLDEIAEAIGVPRVRVKDYFQKGRYLEFVPRPMDPTAEWAIYRKDFESALEKKNQQLTKEYSLWDDVFEIETISLN